MNLTGKKVIVTGGVRGLGRSLVDALLTRQAQVFVFDIDEKGLQDLHDQEPRIHTFQCDLTDYEQVSATVSKYHEQFGAANVLVNNAGILYSAPLIRLTPEGIQKHNIDDWRRVLAINLDAVFYMTACITEKMVMTRTKGVIVNISSISAGGNAGQSAYSAAKAGINALTVAWSKELSMMGIRVMAIAPGFIETVSTKQALSETMLKEIVQKVPLKRLGKPEEVAQAVISVIENDYFNGKIVALDGGLTI